MREWGFGGRGWHRVRLTPIINVGLRLQLMLRV